MWGGFIACRLMGGATHWHIYYLALYWSIVEMRFECLATWKDGSSTFIYGGFSGDGVLDRDSSYRCFVSSLPKPSHQERLSAYTYILDLGQNIHLS